MTVLATGSAPCLGCDTTGGADSPRKPGVAVRKRGLCAACYQTARRTMDHTLYPDCGQRPVERAPYVRFDAPWQPAPWGRVPFSADPEPIAPLPVRWRTLVPTAYDAAAD